MRYICFLLLLANIEWIHAQADYEDFSDLGIVDPLAYLWNNRNNLIQESYAPCRTRYSGGIDREGTCMTGTECKFSGGRNLGRGTCSYFNNCCVYEKTCNQTTNARVSYFTNPSNPRLQPQPCRLNVQLISNKVCQIRVDIIDMVLADPTVTTTADPNAPTTVRCITDRFTVEPANRDVPIPDLCGTNTDTHFYYHLNNQQGLNRAISLNVYLSPPTTSTTTPLPFPRWNIKVTQLECATKKKVANQPITFNKKENKNQPAEDFNLLAPDGCLQYFTQPTGIVKSFGYISSTSTTLTTNQNYAACFKRTPGTCGVMFTTSFLNLRDTNCNLLEYLNFPESTTPPDKVCTLAAMPTSITSNHPGPLYIHFFSAATVGAQAANTAYGYYLMYNTNVPC